MMGTVVSYSRYKLSLATLISQIRTMVWDLAALLSIQVSANIGEKAAEDSHQLGSSHQYAKSFREFHDPGFNLREVFL